MSDPMTCRRLDQTRRSLYEAAAHRYELAGAALANARRRKAQALADLEAAEDDYMAASAGLREHESAPGIPAYTQVRPLDTPRIPPPPPLTHDGQGWPQ